MAADPLLPFPAAKAGPVFISTHIVTTDGAVSQTGSRPAPRSCSARSRSTRRRRRSSRPKDVKYFYVTIPNQPNVKLKYDASLTDA